MEPPPPYNQHVRGIRSYSDVSVDSTLPIKHKKNPGDKEKSAAGVYSEVKDLDDEESPTEYTTAPFHELDGSKQGRIVAAQPSIFSRDSWLYEVLFLFLTMVVGVCLIAILARYNRKPNPLWIGGITLNTVVSIGSTLFRIFLFVPVATCTSQLAWVWFSKRQRPLSDIIIFDRASRTLSGSVQMLFSDVWRSAASIGAIATIGIFTVGPFFQQCLVFYSEKTPDLSSFASASYASTYNGSISMGDWDNKLWGEALPLNMKSAIYNGLLSSDMTSRANPPSSCPSGNCTWDPFPTLAISASCSNTPDSFEIHCSPFTEEDPLWDNIKGIDDAVRPQNCTVAKVLGSERKGVRNRVEPISSNTIGTQPVFWIYSKYADTTDDLDASDWNTMPTGGIVLIEWARLKNLYRPPGQGLYFINQTSTIEASSCHLYTSVQEIRAWVDDGVYGETVIREISNATTEVFAEPGNNNLKENVTASGSTLLRNYKYEYAKSRNFTISHVHQQVLLQGVEVVVGSNAWLKVEDNGFLHAENFVLDRDRDTRVQSVTVTKALYQTPNITNAVLSLARHMTVALRSNDTITDSQFRNSGFEEYVAPSHRVNGTVYRDQIHVEIRWDWLTFPAALLILVFVLLGTTIIETWSEEVGVWKDSPLALLLHSQWETGPERKPTGARTALDIAEEVKGLNAFFVRGGTGEDLGRKSIKRRIFISRDRPEGNE